MDPNEFAGESRGRYDDDGTGWGESSGWGVGDCSGYGDCYGKGDGH